MRQLSLSKQQLIIVAAILLFITILFLFNPDPNHPEIGQTAAIAALMAFLWVTEAIPLGITALFPLVMFPLFGISSGKDIAPTYLNHIMFIFIGGFMLALAMERWHLHRRIALRTILFFGNRPDGLILGFMVASAFLSMWISNTATCIMMFPIAMALIKKLEEDGWKNRNFNVALLLCIAYSCSIGGVSTIIGTPPNLIFIQMMELLFPAAPTVTFAEWILLGLPIAILILISAWVIVCKIAFKQATHFDMNKDLIHDEYQKLGKMSFEEKTVLAVFATTALLWVTRSDIQIGDLHLYGWANLFPKSDFITDGSVAVMMATVLFFIPSHDSKDERILDHAVFSQIPWDIILFFGGGFALAKGIVDSGLSAYIASSFQSMAQISGFSMIISIASLVTFMTELTSNVATTQMLLPILAALAKAMQINPILLMITATISASMAFMMPVATAPNAIIFGSKQIHVIDMVKAGFLINLTGIVIISLIVYFLAAIVFDFPLDQFPDWATGMGAP